MIETGTGFVVAWIEQAPSARPQLKLRTFDMDSLSGEERQVSSAEVEPLIRPALARLQGGGFIVVWADKRANERIRAQRFAADGTKQSAEFRANTAPGLHRVPMVATLMNGNTVIAWRARLPGPLLVHLQIFNATGPVGTEITTALDITDAATCGARYRAVRHCAYPQRARWRDRLYHGGPAGERVRSGRRVRQHPDSRHQRDASPVLLADARAALRRALHAGVDAGGHGQSRRRHQRDGAHLFGARLDRHAARCDRQRGPGQHIDRRESLQPRRRGDRGPTAGDTAFFAWADDSAKGADKAGRAIEGRVLPIPAAGFVRA